MELRTVGGFKYNISLYLQYLRLNFLASVEYKMGFLTVLFNILMSIAVWFTFWTIILSVNGGQFASWTVKQLLLWYGITEFAIGLLGVNYVLLALIFTITEEGLEKHLTKPYHPLVGAVGENLGVTFFLRSAWGLFAILADVVLFHLWELLYQIVLALLISFCGVLLINFLYTSVVTLAFFFGRVEPLFQLFDELEVNLIRLPLHFLPKHIFIAFITVYPLGLIATLPTQLIFAEGWFSGTTIVFPTVVTFAVILFTVGMGVLSNKFFNFGLKNEDP